MNGARNAGVFILPKRWIKTGSVWNATMRRKMKTKLASLLVAASIVTSFYFQSNNAVLDGQGRFLKYKIDTFTSFAVGGWEKYRHDVYEPWRTRLLSTMPANFMFKAWGFPTLP